MTSPAKIVIVDDHTLVREGFVALFSRFPEFEVAAEAEGAREAMEKVREIEPDLLIVDLSLEEGSGFNLIQHVAARHPDVRILVCSMHEDSVYAERCIRLGAMGYVNKQEGSEVVLKATRQVLAGQIYLHPDITQALVARSMHGESHGGSAVDSLTNRELEVLEFLGSGLSVREISERLNLSPKTVETYRERLKQKLEIDSSTKLLHFAVQWTMQGAREA